MSLPGLLDPFPWNEEPYASMSREFNEALTRRNGYRWSVGDLALVCNEFDRIEGKPPYLGLIVGFYAKDDGICVLAPDGVVERQPRVFLELIAE